MLTKKLIVQPGLSINNIKKQKARNELIRWLKQKCDYSDNVFRDPGYSDYYKSMFNIVDTHNFIYANNDIDHELNVGYVEYETNNEKNSEDAELEQFIDVVPYKNKNSKSDAENHNINIVILPGSNHSNANYLYKLLMHECMEINNNDEPYHIPNVSPNPKVPYTINHKKVQITINKEEFYSFVKKYSKK